MVLRIFFCSTLLLLLPALSNAQEKDIYTEWNLESQFDYRYFLEDPLLDGQHRNYPSLALIPEGLIEWNEGRHSLNFKGFFRLDRDENRTHWDIRELYWQYYQKNWELSVGAKKIFWGVTESAHLVDVINQTDQVESFDGEAKLGQPMAHFSLATKVGIFDAFVLPYFRKRIFPGLEGRLRPPFLLAKDDIAFEANAEEWNPDLAFRWAHTLGASDVGVSYFYGNGREPVFLPQENGSAFDIFYPLNHQIGVDLQTITGPWIWKLESFFRQNDVQEVFALAAGFEYTFSNIRESGIDLSVLSEYLSDNRDELALNSLDNDIFLGSRLAFNDVQSTEILFGGIFDLARSSQLWSVEASRRLGSSWKVELEGRFLRNIASEEFLVFFQQDSFLQLRLAKFF
ncbi:MAG: hypothetical protein AAFN81_24940 [Bacteroidota bacterium]